MRRYSRSKTQAAPGPNSARHSQAKAVTAQASSPHSKALAREGHAIAAPPIIAREGESPCEPRFLYCMPLVLTAKECPMRALRRFLAGGLLILVSAGATSVSRPHPGDLDKSFNPEIRGQFVHALAEQPDGKMLIGGMFSHVDGHAAPGIARLNPDGSLDESFGERELGPQFRLGTIRAVAHVGSIALQKDGKILVAGAFNYFHGQPRNAVARLNRDGSLDQDFVSTLNPTNMWGLASVRSAQELDDGKILVVHSQSVARLQKNGDLDISIDENLNSITSHFKIGGILTEPDGSFYVGQVRDWWNVCAWGGGRDQKQGVRIDRFLPSGKRDYTFKQLEFYGDPYSNSRRIDYLLHSGTNILVGGNFKWVDGMYSPVLARLTPRGELDPTFQSPTPSGPGIFQTIQMMAMQHDGKILLAGDMQFGEERRHGITRLNPNGTLDRTFGFEIYETVSAMLVQRDGKLLVGKGALGSGSARPLLVRLLAE